MDDDTVASNPTITDAEIVTDETHDVSVPKKTAKSTENDDVPTGDAAVLLEIETLIKTHITGLQTRRVELKKLREMLEDIFHNNPEYREQEEAVKAATKVKKEIKARLAHQPNALESSEKVKELAQEIKDMDGALSDYLREYGRLSGANEIEDDAGEVHEIIYIAKLIKRLSKR
jgi:hypothetical protein